MNPLLDEDDELLDHENHELTLSTGMILGIFFGLVLLCGLFFGFGYKMGNHKPAPAEPASTENEPSPSANFGGFKPAAGSPAGKSAAAAVQSDAPDSAETSSADTSGGAAGPAAVTPVAHPNPAAPSSAASPVALTPAPPVAAGSFVVQVAAVSHQEDAELLVNALKAKGYPVSAHTEPQDKFFHVQVGPFNNRNDADAAKQRLLADGYQPIVK